MGKGLSYNYVFVTIILLFRTVILYNGKSKLHHNDTALLEL